MLTRAHFLSFFLTAPRLFSALFFYTLASIFGLTVLVWLFITQNKHR